MPLETPVLEQKKPGRPLTRKGWDVICIGSGMGSLAAAAALARFGYAVLVLEAHSQLGGLTHTFQRKQIRWGTGLHYAGWPTAYFNDFPHLWHILTQGDAPWSRLPDDTDAYLRPDGAFLKRGPRERYRADLYAAFPNERPVIDRYLADLRRLTADFVRFTTLQALPPMAERLGLGWLLGRRFLRADRLPLVRYMDQIGASQRLREHLWFTWGNFGGLPGQTSVGAYAIPTEFMHDGLWTLSRGSRSAAAAFVQTITRAGGELRRSAKVTGLLFEGGRVAGVRVGEESIRGRTVISGIGARETYRLLVPLERQPRHTEQILAMPPSCSLFTLYLALDREALSHYGLTAVNYWVEAVPGAMQGYWTNFQAPPPWFLLSLAARFQEEELANRDVVTGEVFVGVSGDRFAQWRGTRLRKRGPEYDDFKGHLMEQTLERLEVTWPGIRRYLRYAEGATPLTIESYTHHFDGAAYGLAPVPGRYSNRALRVATGVPGLLLTGQDICTAGVIGAFYAGLTAASAVRKGHVAKALLRRFA
jgi:all-trans-retinol 13,14-reductase